ncbi:MAG: zinc ribbon domain-containing protein [Dehalococcoidia bacterium]
MDDKFCIKCGTKLLTPSSNCYNCGQSIIPKSNKRKVFVLIIGFALLLSAYLIYEDHVGISQNDLSASVISIEEPKRLDFEKNPDINTLVNKTPTPISTPIPLIEITTDSDLIPSKTFAGSDVCNDGIALEFICVELLEYLGFDSTYVVEIISGLELIISNYHLTKEDFTVRVDTFNSNDRVVNYVGIVLYNSDNSDLHLIVSDVCKFTLVNLDQSMCISSVNRLFKQTIDLKLAGIYAPITTADNGHLLIINQSNIETSEYYIELISHEYFHLYQGVHSDMSPPYTEEDFNKMYNQGPFWLMEGTAEYASFLLMNQMGLRDFEDTIILNAEIVDILLTLEGQAYVKDISISEGVTQNDYISILENSNVYTGEYWYAQSYLAALYAAALSSHDAIMIDYWDDLKEYGAEESFHRNIGISFEEFYIKFDDFLHNKNGDEKLEIILSADVTNSDALTRQSACNDAESWKILTQDSLNILTTSSGSFTNSLDNYKYSLIPLKNFTFNSENTDSENTLLYLMETLIYQMENYYIFLFDSDSDISVEVEYARLEIQSTINNINIHLEGDCYIEPLIYQ